MFFSFHSPVVVFLPLFAISAMYNVRSPLWSVGYIMFWLLCRVWARILHHGRPQAGPCRHPAAPPTEVNSDRASFLESESEVKEYKPNSEETKSLAYICVRLDPSVVLHAPTGHVIMGHLKKYFTMLVKARCVRLRCGGYNKENDHDCSHIYYMYYKS